MSSRAITQDLVAALLDFFRRQPGDISEAARYAQCSRPTARKAWAKGFPGHHNGKPLEQVIKEEQAAARAEMLRETQARAAQAERDREDARKAAVQARKEEGMMVQGTRAVTGQAIVMAQKVITGSNALAERLKQILQTEATKPTPDLTPIAMMNLLREASLVVNRLNDAAYQTMQMERLHLGEPTTIVGVTATTGGGNVPIDITLEEAEIRIKAAQAAVAAHRRALGQKTLALVPAPPPTLVPNAHSNGSA